MIRLTFLLLLSLVTPEDQPMWWAWLHQGDQLIQVDSHGQTLQTHTLPDAVIDSIMALTPDGDLIVYQADGDVLLYDSSAETIIGTLPPDTRTVLFDEYGRRLAYADNDGVHVLNLTSSEVTTHPVAGAYLCDFAGHRVVFVAESGVYEWHLQTSTLAESAAYHADFHMDHFRPTGETLLTDAAGVQVYDPIYEARYPVYRQAMMRFEAAYFVQNGQRVLVRSTEPVMMWWLVERDGEVVRPVQIPAEAIHGTHDGLIYRNIVEGDTELIEVDTGQLFMDRGVWRGGGEWNLVRLDHATMPYGPFRPWVALGEVIYDAPLDVTTQVTDFPLPVPLFTAGQEVIVQTNGDVLYLRENPGTDHEVIMHLYEGDRVEILGEFRREAGYRWWPVRTVDGVEGWAVEAAGDVTTLLPYYPPVDDEAD